MKLTLTITTPLRYQGMGLSTALYSRKRQSSIEDINRADPTSQWRGIDQRSMSISEPEPKNNSTSRKRRYDYEDTHEWPPGDSLDYDFDDDEQEEELTFWQNVGRNWQVVILRATFLVCALSIVGCICCTICYINCRVGCDALIQTLTPWRIVFEFCSQCYEDPMYKKARDLAEIMGIKLDYKTYMKIKETHEFGGRAGFNPMNLE